MLPRSSSSWFARHAVVLSLLLAAPLVAQAQPTASSNTLAAQERFNRGRELFERQQNEAALAEFRASLELYSSPNTRLYVGLCLQRLGRLADAYVELDRTAHEAADRVATNPLYATARDLAQRERDALGGRIGRLRLRVEAPPEGAVVRVGQTEVARAAWEIALPHDPGTVQVSVEAPGHRPFRQDAQITAGATTEVVVHLERAPEAPPAPPVTVTQAPPVLQPPRQPVPEAPPRGGGVRTAGFVVAGVGVAGVAAFAVLGTMARGRFEQLQTECRTRCPASRNGDIDAGERLQLGANISLGVGILGAVTGVVMIAAGGPSRAPVESSPRASRWSPWFDASRGVVGVRGAF